MPGNLLDTILQSGGGEESNLVNLLYDTKNFQRQKMTSEISPDLISGFSVMGTIQKRFQSKVLKSYETEFLSVMKSKDRKGIIELLDLVLGMRRALEGGED